MRPLRRFNQERVWFKFTLPHDNSNLKQETSLSGPQALMVKTEIIFPQAAESQFLCQVALDIG